MEWPNIGMKNVIWVEKKDNLLNGKSMFCSCNNRDKTILMISTFNFHPVQEVIFHGPKLFPTTQTEFKNEKLKEDQDLLRSN